MTQEEAIKILKDFHDKSALFSVRTALETLHPELKESEDERIRKEIIAWLKNSEGQTLPIDRYNAALAWLEKQGEQKPADKVEPKCDESETKIFDAPTPFEDKLYAFVAACEFLAIPSKIEFILEHSQEILDAAREQIGKEQSSAWSEEEEVKINRIVACLENLKVADNDILLKDVDWLKSLKARYTWKPSDEQMADLWNMLCECRPADHQLLQDIYYGLKKLREE